MLIINLQGEPGESIPGPPGPPGPPGGITVRIFKDLISNGNMTGRGTVQGVTGRMISNQLSNYFEIELSHLFTSMIIPELYDTKSNYQFSYQY